MQSNNHNIGIILLQLFEVSLNSMNNDPTKLLGATHLSTMLCNTEAAFLYTTLVYFYHRI